MNTVGITVFLLLLLLLQLCTDKCIPQGERVACVAVFRHPPLGQPHAIFRGLLSITASYRSAEKDRLKVGPVSFSVITSLQLKVGPVSLAVNTFFTTESRASVPCCRQAFS